MGIYDEDLDEKFMQIMRVNKVCLQDPKYQLAGMAIALSTAVRLGHMTREEAQAKFDQAKRELELE